MAKKKRNVAAGFYDEDGYFHPIRASFDYDSHRAGEGRKKNPRKKRIDWRRVVYAGAKGRANPRQLLFKSKAAALKYAREHGAKRFSIRNVKAGR